MEKSKLRPSSRTAEANWIADQLAPFGSGVAAIVPNGFEAYVRVLHPATDTNDAPMHGLMWQQSPAERCTDSHNSTPSIARPSLLWTLPWMSRKREIWFRIC